jgi:hypothetical protein
MDEYEDAHQALDGALRAGVCLTPQVAGRRINTFYRAVVQRVARKLWEAGSSASSEAEREHLRYTAQWLGYRPDEGQ